MMKYKITKRFCWFRNGSIIVAMYFINEKPFTFDELPDGHLEDLDLIDHLMTKIYIIIFSI